MRVHYTGRHADISESEMAKAKRKLEKIHRILGGRRQLEAHVTISFTHHRYEAEVTVHALHHTLVVTASHAQPFPALNAAIDKLEKQAKKEKTKLVLRRRPLRQRDQAPAAVEAILTQEPEAAPADGPASGEPLIVRGNGMLAKPTTVEEARLHLEEQDRDQITFRDLDSGSVCVLLRRRDGRLELVDAGA